MTSLSLDKMQEHVRLMQFEFSAVEVVLGVVCIESHAVHPKLILLSSGIKVGPISVICIAKICDSAHSKLNSP